MLNDNKFVLAIDESRENRAKIKVVGVGGAGGNAVNRMIESGLSGVDFIAVNTDSMALEHSLAGTKITIGQKLCKGLGAGSNPEKGFEAVQEDRAAVIEALDGADMVFITAGMGGGTGTGAAPVVAEIAKELGILTVGVVTKPFMWEGPVRNRHSKLGLDALKQHVDTIISIENQNIFKIINNKVGVKEAFTIVDGVLMNAVKGISDIILKHGEIQVDFADVRQVMLKGGYALIGTGSASGENKATMAAQEAITSPLLEDLEIQGAGGLLINITGGEDLSMMELGEVMNFINEAVGIENNPHIIFGHVTDPEMQDTISITVIATSFHESKQTPIEQHPAAQPQVQQSAPNHQPQQSVQPVQQPQQVTPQAVQPVQQPVQQVIPQEPEPAPQVQQQIQDVEQVQVDQQQEDLELPPASPFMSHPVEDTQPAIQEETATQETVENQPAERTNPFASSYGQRSSYEQESSSSYTNKQTTKFKEATPAYLDENVDYERPAFLRNQE